MKNHLLGIARLKLIDLARNTKIKKVLEELRIQQYESKSTLEKIQNERFDELMFIAKESTSFYSSQDKYEKIKKLEKEMVRNNFDSFKSKSFKGKLYKKATGGSTGSPLVYYTTSESISYMWAGIILSWEVAGYKFGEKVAFLAGTSIIKKDFKHDIFYKLMNIDVYSTYKLNETDILDYLKSIRKTKAKIIYGYATAISFAADIIDKYQLNNLPELKGIISTAEVLTDENRNKIEKAFKVKVYNQYGCNEAGISAFECEHRKIHLISTRCKYEVDDEGNLYSTDLSNKGFIMIKYFTGDQIEISTLNSCDCKRNFPIIKNIRGRSYDMIIDSKNNVMHAAFFNILFKNDPSIKQFQVQFNREKISIYLNTENGKSDKKDYYQYIDAIKKHLYFNAYEIILNADFIQTNSSKHRYVINTGI